MSELATSAVPTKPRGNYRISARLQRALMLLASGQSKTQLEACEAAGIAPRTFQRALQRQSVRDFMQERIRTELGLSATRAATRIGELLTSANEMVSFRASTYALATGAGVVAPNANSHGVNVTLNQNIGYVLDLRPAAEKGGPIGAEDAKHLSGVGGVLLGSRREVLDLKPNEAPAGGEVVELAPKG